MTFPKFILVPGTMGETREETREETKGKTAVAILNLIRSNPKLTTTEIAIALNKTDKGIEYHLTELKKTGWLSRSGSTKSGIWIILKK